VAEIIVRHNGPYLVQGHIMLKDHAGNVIETTAPFKLCRCGHSRTKPFCDGTHKIIGFVDPPSGEADGGVPLSPPPLPT
jgi:CDGSH-type Zn-finger protein